MQYFDKVVYTFSADNEPTGTIDSGEIVIFRTQDCFSNQMHSESQLVTSCDYSKMNPATGPLFVRDAQPGDVIKVELLDVQCDTIGTTTTLPKIGPLWDKCETRTKRIPIENGKAVFNDVTFPINPMIGVIGVAPEKGKSVPCGYPGSHGGNLDCKLMVKGNVLFASHDYEIVQTVANRIIEIADKGCYDRQGTYEEYVDWRKANHGGSFTL